MCSKSEICFPSQMFSMAPLSTWPSMLNICSKCQVSSFHPVPFPFSLLPLLHGHTWRYYVFQILHLQFSVFNCIFQTIDQSGECCNDLLAFVLTLLIDVLYFLQLNANPQLFFRVKYKILCLAQLAFDILFSDYFSDLITF